MSKRRVDDTFDTAHVPKKQVKFHEDVKKHTLSSDEEDDDDNKYNILDDNDIEGEEDGSADRQDGEVRMTAFNMNEEMEMGHFDKDGHFIWKNEKEVRDNWLDNVDWQRVNIAQNAEMDDDAELRMQVDKGLGDESDEDVEVEHFDLIQSYRLVFTYLKPGESVNKALKRLGGDLSKLSSIERLKRKKAGTLVTSKEVTELTELANAILTQTGNMDVYQETYEQIQDKLKNYDKKKRSRAHIVEAELDMYADDFEERSKEKSKTTEDTISTNVASSSNTYNGEEIDPNHLMWEFKWDQNKDDIEGPYDSQQMNKWSEEGHFKTGVWVRKCGGTDANFYSSNRIDFDLYL